MIVSPEEFVSARVASRKLGELIDRLETTDLAKAVIVDRNRPRAVVLSVLAYEALVNDGLAAALAEPLPAEGRALGAPLSPPQHPSLDGAGIASAGKRVGAGRTEGADA